MDESEARPGTVWVSRGGSQWTVVRRRRRANGLVEALLRSSGGAERWVDLIDLEESYAPAPVA